MKILFLSPGNSIHTQKWVSAFSKTDEVYLVTMHADDRKYDETVTVINLPVSGNIGYYLNAPFVYSIAKKIKPDVINVHYASGYGTLARIAKLKPYILNVWGSDVFDFPYESKMHMKIIQKNLHVADQIASTSYIMKEQVEKLITPRKEIAVTPFGIDTEMFTPLKNNKDTFVIGTVKTLAPKYGISDLILAYNYAFQNGLKDSKLCLVGGGPQEAELKALASSLPCSGNIEFIGRISHHEVPEWLNKFDIYCALSEIESESFGVAVLEAESCGIPVIVSNAGGLPEVVKDGVTGIVVPKKNYTEAGKAILKLAENHLLREQMGKAGREIALEKYDWKKCVDIMRNVYASLQRV